MRVAIHQPQYLPWTTLIAKGCFVDTFILLDDVQFQRRGFRTGLSSPTRGRTPM